MKLFGLIFVLVMSCSHKVEKKPESQLVNNFVKAWNADYGPFPAQQKKTFHQYLTNVEAFYTKNEVAQKFPSYLSSLSNNLQLIAHAEMNLPSKFKRHYGHWPAQKSPNYVKYKNDQLKELVSRLEDQRMKKIKQDIGFDKFERLQDQMSKFDKKGQDLKLVL